MYTVCERIQTHSIVNHVNKIANKIVLKSVYNAYSITDVNEYLAIMMARHPEKTYRIIVK